jgi:hypothetical protein
MKNLTRRALLVGGAAAVLGGALFKFLGNGGAKLKAFLASPKISGMPTKQVAGVLIDWKARSKVTYELLFDYEAKGPHLPVIWLDKERRNYNFDMFALPAYLGDYRQNPERAGSHEALSGLGSVLGATLTGIDMSDYKGRNFVRECLGYHQQNRVAKIKRQTVEVNHHFGT